MPQLPDLEAWAIFAKVAEAGSFSHAADELGLSKATVSKVIARLEGRLGERLFHRTSRRLSLTETGRVLSVRAARILDDAEAVEAEALAQSASPRGRVRMAAPMSFGLEHLAPVLPDFLAAYPAISIDLHLGDEVVDLVGGGFDLGLRIAALADSSLVARRLCQVRRLLVGAPEYFASHGRPSHPRDLSHHACLGYSYLPTGDKWPFVGPSGEDCEARIERAAARQQCRSADAVAPRGHRDRPPTGIPGMARPSRGPPRSGAARLGRAPIALNIVMPSGGPRPLKVAVLVEFLITRFSERTAPWSRS